MAAQPNVLIFCVDEMHNLWYRPAAQALRADLQAALLHAYAADTPWFPIPPGNA